MLPAPEAALDYPALAGRRQAASSPPPTGRVRTGAIIDRLFGWTARGAALLTLGLLLGILVSLFIGAWPAISKYGFSFFTSTTWDPVSEEFGGLVMIYGPLATSLIALLIAVPVVFGIRLFRSRLLSAGLT